MQQKNTKQLVELQRRISSGEASETDRKRYARWLAQLNIPQHYLSDQLLEEKRLVFEQRFKQAYNKTTQHSFSLYRWLSAAAAILILTTAGWFFSSRQKPITTYTTIATSNGERKVITLSDGSTVTLNNASSVRFPQEFQADMREITLEGEAFFEVVHQIKRPFIVHANRLNVQVLGTSFDVRAYRADQAISVTVATGKVGITAKGNPKSWMLTPDRQLKYDVADSSAKLSSVTAADYTGWQKGELIFKEEQLGDICKKLERWYGVRISIRTAALKNKRLSLKMHNESLSVVMRALSVAGSFRYELKGKTVSIYK